MNLWVVASVSIVTILILMVANALMSRAYERELRTVLTHHADATTHAIDLRMQSVCRATATAAWLASDDLQDPMRTDSVLARTLGGIDYINMASVTYCKTISASRFDAGNTRAAYIEYHSGQPQLVFATLTTDPADENWQHSYILDEPYLSPPYQEHQTTNQNYLVSYSVPLHGSKSKRYGMLSVSIELDSLKNIVIADKTRSDIDVAIYARTGLEVMAHSPKIKARLETDPASVVCEERLLPRLGWTVRLAVPREAIDQSVGTLTFWLGMTLITLLLFTSLIQMLVVRHIGLPFAIEQKKTLAAKAAIQHEMDIAAATQRELVPHTFPAFPALKQLDLHACLRPAMDVAGDLYDYYIKDDRLCFCIGDVSGKGLPASLFMAATRYLFRSAAQADSLTQAFSQMNRALCADNAQCMFVTFWAGILDLNTGEVQYVNAGHCSPILIQTKGAHFLPMADDMPLGVWEEAAFTQQSLTLNPGDRLLLYTDGVTEAKDNQSRELGDKATLIASNLCQGLNARQTIDLMLQRVQQHTNNTPQSDDITMVCIGYSSLSSTTNFSK